MPDGSTAALKALLAQIAKRGGDIVTNRAHEIGRDIKSLGDPDAWRSALREMDRDIYRPHTREEMLDRALTYGPAVGEMENVAAKGVAAGERALVKALKKKSPKAAADPAAAIEKLQMAPSVKWGFEPDWKSEFPRADKPPFGKMKGEPGSILSRARESKQEGPSLEHIAFDDEGNPVGIFSRLTKGKNAGAFKIVVDPAAQRKGIGTKLLDAAAKEGFDVAGSVEKNRFTPSGRKLVESWLKKRAAPSVKKKLPPFNPAIFNNMTLEEATEAARQGLHLRPLEGGGFHGAPSHVKSDADLQALRSRIDKLTKKGVEGAPFYDESTREIARVSGLEPGMGPETRAGKRASHLAKGGAVYSAGASPTDETNAILKQTNAKMISGADVKPMKPAQFEAVREGFAENPETGGYDFDPDRIVKGLGWKTEPYGKGKNPNIDPASLVHSVNDRHVGTAFEYPLGEGENTFSRGFTDAEHAFLTGEHLLAAERANKMGIAPSSASGPYEWTPNRTQAAQWKAVREGKGHEEAGGIHENLAERTAYITGETAPGANTGHGAGYQDIPRDERMAHEAAHIAAQGQRSVPLESIGLEYQQPIEAVGGNYVSSEGLAENNLADVQRPIISHTITDKGKTISPPEVAAMESVMRPMGVLRAQESVGANHFIPANKGMMKNPKTLTGFQISGDPAKLDAIYQALDAEGLNAVRVEDGVMNGGMFANEEGTHLDGKTIQAKLDNVLAKLPDELKNGVNVSRGSWWQKLEEVPWDKEEGTGRATKWMFEDNPLVPNRERRFDVGGWPEEVAKHKQLDDLFYGEHGLYQRQDLERLKSLIVDRGFEGAKKFLTENGFQGFPVALLAAAGLYEGSRDRKANPAGSQGRPSS